jgi:elongation factor G
MCSQNVTAYDVPSNMADLVTEKRRELIEVVSEVDDQLAEAFLNDEPITANQLKVCST